MVGPPALPPSPPTRARGGALAPRLRGSQRRGPRAAGCRPGRARRGPGRRDPQPAGGLGRRPRRRCTCRARLPGGRSWRPSSCDTLFELHRVRKCLSNGAPNTKKAPRAPFEACCCSTTPLKTHPNRCRSTLPTMELLRAQASGLGGSTDLIGSGSAWIRIERRRSKGRKMPDAAAMAVVGTLSQLPNTHSGQQLSSLK